MGKEEEKKYDFVEGVCPLLDLPCARGEEMSLNCWTRVQGSFDPVSSFGDLCIMECAKQRADKMRGTTIKFLN